MTPQKLSNEFGIFLSRAAEIIKQCEGNDQAAIEMAANEAQFGFYIETVSVRMLESESDFNMLNDAVDCELPESMKIYRKYPHKSVYGFFFVELMGVWYELYLHEKYTAVELTK